VSQAKKPLKILSERILMKDSSIVILVMRGLLTRIWDMCMVNTVASVVPMVWGRN